ncbi:CRISPR-associated protein DevR [Methanosarcina sp. 2.H.T.1A.6]|uniref:type I-B CRISPR-associated protein Cas7/Cst2/DevR n=1 Tax=unclassified Methanosarcina TaxID=2644672 RepID=UPI00062193A9|nr:MULTISPECIES: type I-B CRISPR-associated protein Cas7/Cst2/DevR [unclassified Methanosarcina]KKG13762.1 CRISPR-associated protein DevR [Methanosarcina sp. 2.H.T.1A.3]KKG16351.1 CRISPR-associated protein DevR [Methanosarcina sp. 2.H.T.1A.15]KKG21474.1 CRISPR-associated protein DevR [Methanosarcina sp. 2.H.T.1A.8]KKG21966.1 CRISPR-associated protein DevR [Methanosarcina sp. 2.H.T.1A.6]
MTHTINGFMLIDAPHSALNNAGNDSSERTENVVRVKAIRKGRKVYPYVSGQALRYWWRTTLEKKFNWNVSPIEREKKIAFTSANPVEYDDDDVFGYMRALKKADGGTVTRLSVLKNSPLVSVAGQVPTEDFGVMARHEGDPVPYEHEFYSTVLKGIFSLDLDNIGVFYKNEKTGYRNMYSELEAIAEKNGAEKVESKWIMPAEVRMKRAKDVLKALPYLTGGAKQTSHLTDVSPKLLILAGVDGGNHLFMNLVREENGEAIVDIEALEDVISDYSDILLTDIYIGRRKGFMDELDPALKALTEKYADNSQKVIYGSINEMVDSFVQTIPGLMR